MFGVAPSVYVQSLLVQLSAVYPAVTFLDLYTAGIEKQEISLVWPKANNVKQLLPMSQLQIILIASCKYLLPL